MSAQPARSRDDPAVRSSAAAASDRAAADEWARPIVVATTYHAMRRMALNAALLAFVRRWGVYGATAVLVFSAGANDPLAIAAAVATVLTGPLRAAAASGFAIVPVAAAYALAGALVVAASRPLWWPRRWADAERALPLDGATLRRSDRRFALLTTVPWHGAQLVGLVGLVLGGAGAATADRTTVVVAWLLSVAASLWLATLWMAAVRGAQRPQVATVRSARRPQARIASWRPRAAPRATTRERVAAVGARRALVVLALARGRAPRTAWTLAVAVALVVVSPAVVRWTGRSLPWSLAALALGALGSTGALRAATLRELRPLWAAHAAWPLDADACERARLALASTPAVVALGVGVGAVAVVALVDADAVRAGALVAWCASVASGCALEATTPATMRPQDRAARWVLILATTIACGSEILRG